MTVKSKCVHCGAEVSEWTQDCPKCGRPVANRDAPMVSDLGSKFKNGGSYAKKSKAPLMIGIAAIVVIAVVIYLMNAQ
ncbi:MAG: hypothetical protein JW864_02855 [Spirochaetes bacterium]|nr:hypothetical protein [Spirochaetota bacterium]